MRTTNRQIIIFAVVIILLCFISVIVFTLPSFFKMLDLTTKSNIGSAMGGITAPVIGVISSILLYLALTRQTESNVDQRIKNESDIIFLLLNQLDSEIAGFYYKYKQGKEEFKYHGIEAINDFSNEFRYGYSLKDFHFTFKHFFQANQLLLLIRSYKLIEKRIELSALSEEMKHLFQDKLNAFFDCRLRKPLQDISDAVDEHENMKDEITEEIQKFIKPKIN